MDYHIDAKDKILGRLASEAALILQGKKNPNYHPRNVGNDKVYIKNAEKVRFTGKKSIQKIYYKHTGYVGHLKEKTLKQAMEKDPKWVIRRAVRKMLPKNFLNQKRIKNLIFVD